MWKDQGEHVDQTVWEQVRETRGPPTSKPTLLLLLGVSLGGGWGA